jgi:deoxyribose-phosphate aldolase
MNLTKTKVEEAVLTVKEGAQEVDMVINVGMLKAGHDDYVREEIREIKQAVGHNIILKVIIETCLLNNDEIVRACKAAKEAGADFVKTSTGFSTGGATVEAVRLMRETVGPEMGVKASGGVRTHEDLIAMVEAGANRIGTSSGAKII